MTDEADLNDPAPSPSPTPGARIPWLWLAALIPLGVGAFLGYQVAYQASVGGLGGALGAAFLAYAVGGLVLVAFLVGIANSLRAEGRGRRASNYSFAAGALILAGAGGGWASVPILDIGYHEPVVLQARGEASVALEGVPAFEPSTAGRANCTSVVAGTDVSGVSALSLGDLGGHVLRAGINLPVQGASGGHISLFVDAAHIPQGSVVPMWDTGEVEIQAASDGSNGSIRFVDAPIRVDPEMGAPASSWPTHLTGEITWSCGPWFSEGEAGAPTVVARISLDLSGVDWNGTPGTDGSCEFESDGSVANVVGDQVGLLQGQPMSLALGLLGDPRAGDEVHLMLTVRIPAPSGASLPLGAIVAATRGQAIGWTELVVIDEIGEAGLVGRLTFSDLPNEGTQVAGWPATLSGALSWECG